MKKILLISFCLTLFSVIKSQDITDVIYLNNGSQIRGKILENSPERTKIESCCGSIFVLSQAEIAKIDHETDIKSKNISKQKGYVNYTSLGLLIGSTVNEKVAPYSILMEHNYKFNKYFAIGGVFGVESLKEPVCPVALNLKAFIPLNSGELFFGTTGGYSISTENPVQYGIKDASGGYMFNMEIGYSIPVSELTGFFIAIGYRYNELNYKMEEWWMNNADRKIYFNRISLRTGITLY
jgi:hypothetical protein